MKTEDDLTLDEALELIKKFFEDSDTDIMSSAKITLSGSGYYTVYRDRVEWEAID